MLVSLNEYLYDHYGENCLYLVEKTIQGEYVRHDALNVLYCQTCRKFYVTVFGINTFVPCPHPLQGTQDIDRDARLFYVNEAGSLCYARPKKKAY